MPRSIGLAAALLLFALRAAAAPPVCAVASWDCIGAIEMRVGDRALRMSKYANDEMLAEIEQGGIIQRYLVVQPSGSELYFGLSSQQIDSPAANPFAFFDYAFALPVAALRLAFPAGPSAVPDSAAQRDVLLQGIPVSVHASKRSDGHIDFSVEGTPLGPISGQIVATFLPPLDGSYPLAGWMHKSGTRFNVLSDARRAPRQ